MRIVVYQEHSDKPVRVRKWVRDVLEAQRFCAWWERTYGHKAFYRICR